MLTTIKKITIKWLQGKWPDLGFRLKRTEKQKKYKFLPTQVKKTTEKRHKSRNLANTICDFIRAKECIFKLQKSGIKVLLKSFNFLQFFYLGSRTAMKNWIKENRKQFFGVSEDEWDLRGFLKEYFQAKFQIVILVYVVNNSFLSQMLVFF